MGTKAYRSTLAYTTSALALALTSAAPAFAADQQAQGGIQLEEIIVNARRVDENIQRVPIAITAFSPEKLATQDIKDAWTLTKSVNGFAICCSQGNASFVYIRGINNGTPTYFNDVPLANAGGYSGFFDVSNVQVLKGPQGTLFGQASNAGALVYTPKKPGEVFGGNISISAGNYGRRTIEGALDIPLVEDKVLFRMAAQSYYREGFVEDIRNGRAYGDQNFYIMRPSLIIRPTEDIENYTLFQVTKSKGTNAPFVLNDINFSDVDATLNPSHPTAYSLSGTSTLAGDPRGTQRIGNLGLTGTAAQWYAIRDQVLAHQIALGPYKVDGYSTGCSTPLGPSEGPGSDALNPASGSGSGPIANLNYARAACPFSWSRDIFFSNTTTWSFADKLSLKNIFGYRTSHSFSQPGDTDGTPLILFDSGSPKNSSVNHGTPAWSDELQLQGTKVFDFLDFTVGTFHTGQQNKPVKTYSYSFGVSESLAQTKNTSKSRAVYGQANVDFGHFSEALDGLSFTGGYRYTWDHITQVIYSYNSVTGVPTTTLGAPGSTTAAAGDGRFSAGVYTLQLQYQLTPDIMLFFNNSKGYSAGGLQDVAGKEKFQPDVLTNYEGGIKGTFDIGGVKVRTATSYFYGDFSNVKVSVTQLINKASSPPPAPAGLVVVTENAATAYITGLDSEFTVIPTDWFELNGNVAYTKTKFTKWDNFINTGTSTVPVLTPYSSASSPFSGVAKWKWTLRPTVHASWLDEAKYGAVSFTASLTYTGPMSSAPGKPTGFQASPGNPNTTVTPRRCRTAANGYGPLSADGVCVDLNTVSSFYNLDLNLDWRDILGHEGLTGAVFVTNVTKNITAYGGCYCDVALGLNAPIPAVPRMFGVRLGYSF